jgi:hypothetical protein
LTAGLVRNKARAITAEHGVKAARRIGQAGNDPVAEHGVAAQITRIPIA